MLLTFQKHQLQQLGDSRFAGKLRNILLEGAADPAATRAQLASPQGDAALRGQIAKAHGHGLSSELDVARYVITSWLLGLDFDTRFPAMAEVLASDRLTPSQKAEALERIAETLLATLRGEVS